MSAYQMKAPRISFVTEKAAARTLAALGAAALNLEEADGVAALDEIDENSPRIAAFVPGGAGSSLAVDVISLTKSGNIRKAPAGNNPPTQLSGAGVRDDHKDQAVLLARQSNDITDPKFNLYLSDPIIATYNQNRDAASSVAPLILASENAVARLSPGNPANDGLTWLGMDQRLAARTMSPYLGVDFVDTEGNSLPAIDAMSLEMYQKAQYKHDNPNMTLGTITITNPMGVTVDMTGGLSQTAVDTITVSIISHPLDCTTPPTITPYALVETDVNSLKFKDAAGKVELDIDADPAEPLPSPLFDPATPDELSVTVTAPVDGVTLTASKLLLETGLNTQVFSDTVIEAHMVLGNRDLPANQTNTVTGTLRNLLGQTDNVTLAETAPGSRTFVSSDGHTTLQIQAILDLDWHLVPAPTPDITNFIYAYVTDPTLKVQNSPVLLTEEGDDSPDYQNYVEPAEKQINGGYGEDDVPSLDTLNSQVIPAKKFYVEAHNPSMKDGDQVTFEVQDEYGATTSTETLALQRVDALRLRNTMPVVLFGGPGYSPAGYAVSKESQGNAPQPPGTKGVTGAAVQATATDTKGRTHKNSSPSVTYAAIGDSLTAGFHDLVLRQDFQKFSYPNILAQEYLHAAFPQPLIAEPGIPGRVYANDDQMLFALYDESMAPSDGVRTNENELICNFGQPGSAIANIARDVVVCSTNDTGTGYNPTDAAEHMRQVILTNPTSSDPQAPRQRHPAGVWANTLKPTLVTIWAGNNDSLGVISAPPGGEICPGPADQCNHCQTRPAHGDPYWYAENLTRTTNSNEFRDQFKLIVDQVASATTSQGSTGPDLIVATLPPVSAAATAVRVGQHAQTRADGTVLGHPFADLNPRYQVEIRYKAWGHQGHPNIAAHIRQATFIVSADQAGSQVSLLAMVRSLANVHQSWPVPNPDNLAITQFGSNSRPRDLRLFPQEVLSEEELNGPDGLSQTIIGFNRSIITELVSRSNPNWQDGIKEGKVQVLDAYYLLSRLAGSPKLWNDPTSNSAWALAEGAPPEFRSVLAANDAEAEIMVQQIKALGVTTKPLGGLFSLDHVHLTQTASWAVATLLRNLIGSALKFRKDGHFGGLSNSTQLAPAANLQDIHSRDPLRGGPR